jgi:hypothetical protein
MRGCLQAVVDLSSVSRSAQDSRSVVAWSGVLLAVLAIVAASWFVVFLWDRYRRELLRAANDPRTLFQELCRAHRLSRRERRLLWQAAAYHRLEQPALVFAIPHFVSQLADSTQPHADTYAGLAVRLFGSLAGAGGPASTSDADADENRTVRSEGITVRVPPAAPTGPGDPAEPRDHLRGV